MSVNFEAISINFDSISNTFQYISITLDITDHPAWPARAWLAHGGRMVHPSNLLLAKAGGGSGSAMALANVLADAAAEAGAAEAAMGACGGYFPSDFHNF